MWRMVLAALRDGPRTRGELVAVVATQRPELNSAATYRRTDPAMGSVAQSL